VWGLGVGFYLYPEVPPRTCVFTSTSRRTSISVLRVDRWATQGLGGVAFISELGLVAAILESDFLEQRQK